MNLIESIKIINTALELAPLAVDTITGIREIIAKDPNVPADLQSLLVETKHDNELTAAGISKWMQEHPER